MSRIKGINELKEQLINFEQDVSESIASELLRIGRTVKFIEFSYNPFNDDVEQYTEAIRLDNNLTAIIDTTFDDVEVKDLSEFISDCEIGHWGLLDLLNLLKKLNHD